MFSEMLKKRRKQLNLSLLEVAEAIGVTESTLQRYESGTIKNVPHEKIEQLSYVLKCSPAYLMGWIDTVTDENKEDELIIAECANLSVENKKRVLDYIALIKAADKR